MQKERNITVLVAILTFNCASKTSKLIKALNILDNIIKKLKKDNISLKFKIFDDCSSDKTLEILLEHINKKDIFVSSENLGYGGNVKKAFDYGIKNKFSYLAIFPGDMQRDFNDLLKMVKKITTSNYDVIVGKKSKFIKFEDMPIQRKLGNLIVTQLAKIWNDQTKDPLAGFKIYKIKTCKDILWLCQNRFCFDLDFSFWASLRNLKIYPLESSVTYEDHISTIPSSFLLGLSLVIRFFMLGIILQPVIRILRLTKQT